MHNSQFLYDFEDEMKDVLKVKNASDIFVGKLRNEVRLAIHAEKQAPTKKRFGWQLALGVVAVALIALMLIGPKNVWAMMQRWFGYVPGMGFVENGDRIWMLDSPIVMERDGVTLSVTESYANEEKTVLFLEVDGLKLSELNQLGEGIETGSIPFLVLADGSKLQAGKGEGNGWGTGYGMRYVFPALPADVHDAAFVLPILLSYPAGFGPENWVLNLHYVEAPLDVVMPAIEVLKENFGDEPLIEEEDLGEAVATASDEPEDINQNSDSEIKMVVTRMATLENGYVFDGYLDASALTAVNHVFLFDINVIDADGKNVPTETIPTDEINADGKYFWQIETNRKDITPPISFEINSLMLNKDVNIPFEVDLGDTLALGDTIALDQELIVNDDVLLLKNVQLIEKRGVYYLEFHFENNDHFSSMLVADLDIENQYGAGGGGGGSNMNELLTGINYETIPSGKKEFVIHTITVKESGVWRVNWDFNLGLDEQSNNQTDNTGEETACLTFDGLMNLLKSTDTYDVSGFAGRLLLSTPNDNNTMKYSLVSLDGSEEVLNFEGNWPALSPDGKNVAYSGEEGLMIYEIESGTSASIENTKQTDYAPVWSGDGEWIAFKDVENGRIAKVRADGSGLSEVYDAEEVIHPMQWLGEEIFYEAFANGGVKIKAVNVVSGEVREIVQTEIIKPNGKFAVSPDGEWIAYDDVIFGQNSKGIYLQEIGAEERKLLVDVDDVYVFTGDWEINEKWLAVTIYGPEPALLPVLINVENCEVLPLDNLHGEVHSWEVQ